jgi:hypothetical protein
MSALAEKRQSVIRNPKGGPQQLGPYSRKLRRGVISDKVDGRSTLGRFCRDLEAQLVAHIGGAPSVTQRMLIERAIKVQIQLDMLDTKLMSGDWTPHDQRTHGALLNALRLTCRELGMKAAPKPAPTLADITARIVAEKAERGAA